MKRPSILLAALTLSTSLLHAQDNPPPNPPPDTKPADARQRPHHPPRPEHGFFALLDANRDGALDREELNRAADALRRFDRDNDGRITPREMQRDGQREQHGRRDGDRDRDREGDRGPRDLKKDGDRGPKPPPRDESRGSREEARHDGPRPESRDGRGPRPSNPPRGGDEHARRPAPPHHHHHHPHHHGPPPSDRRDQPAPRDGDRDRHSQPDRRDRPEERGPGGPRPSGPGPI